MGLDSLPSVVSGAWKIALVVLVFALAWYILSIAKEAWTKGSISGVFESATAWVITVVFAVLIAIPLAGWMFGKVYSQVFEHAIVKTAEKTVTETARFAVDVVDGDSTITLPNIPSPRGGEPGITVIDSGRHKGGIKGGHNPPPVDAQSGDDAYQEYLRQYYQQHGQAPAPNSEPIGGVHHGQQPGVQPPTTAPPVTSGGTYTIQRGDTLYKVARAQTGDGENWKVLCSLNFGGNKQQCDNLRVGQVIKLP